MIDAAAPISSFARYYIETPDMALVPISPGEKGPKGQGWNQPGGYFVDPLAAEKFWQENPTFNMGVVHAPSQVCSLDVDDVRWTRQVLSDLLGLDLDAMALVYPTVVGNPERFRIMFRVPEGVELNRHALAWPSENDPDGAKHKDLLRKARAAAQEGDDAREKLYRAEAQQYARLTVFELRAGLTQDVLPPSIHPGTGKPYVWRTAPGADGLPVLNVDLQKIWANWDIFKRDAEAACPWAPKLKAPPVKKRRPPKAGSDKPSVIDEFNRCHDVTALLRAHGYTRKGTKWLFPGSSTGLPGITFDADEGRVYSHHAADPLANGHKNDAFEVYCILEHGGDQARAVKEAARMLGISNCTSVSSPNPPLLGELPPAPTDDSGPSPADEVAPPAAGGQGEGIALEQVLRRFALIEGTTQVWDIDKAMRMKKSAFEALITKATAKEWLDHAGRKLIADDQVKDMERAKKNAGKKAGALGMEPTERYVYIDGTKDVWDREKKRRIPEGALKMALGDFYQMWLNSPDRRVVDVDHIVFDPTMTKDPAIYINTFEGLPIAPIDDPSACENILWLIKSLCNNEEEPWEWLVRWLAYPLQNIGSKMDTAVLMHSTMEGSGKSLLFADIMGRLYGQYAATVGQAQLEGNFNVWQSRKLWAVFEEVVSRDQRYNQVGKIKHMITGKTVRMESKFVNGWEEANFMNAVFLSNEILPWPISDSDRRQLVVWPLETLPVDRQKAIGRELDGNGVAALYGWLLNVDLGDFDQRTRPPKTAARQRLVALSRNGWQAFLHLWRTGELGRNMWGACLSSDLYALFLEWCSRGKEGSISHTRFAEFISADVPKTDRGIPWTDGNTRRFGIFFFPDDAQASLPPSMKSADLGVCVSEWRAAARLSGWNVDHWDHVKAVAA